MKKRIFLIFALVLYFNIELQAQEKKNDTIYIKTNVEDISSKFHSTFENQYKINFFFNVKWQLFGSKRNEISFYYQSPKKNGTNEWSIFIKDTKEFLLYKNYFTLDQFTSALKNNSFLMPIANGTVQIIMLYGSKCSSKVEIYPVKVSTNLSSEG
ncbi:MAG: hypothetical protein EOO91_17515 [Pedobacter sp.]|nr:MAG: hypothetical protein EOO91_17515 [Pedobacter sp.]